MNEYQRKCKRRLEGLFDASGIPVNAIRSGELGGIKSWCFILEPIVKDFVVVSIVNSAQKCFRKATVKVGRGATRPYCPETVYPTVYITFDK